MQKEYWINLFGVIRDDWIEKEINLRVSALAFASTFSLVPMFGVFLALASAFPSFFQPVTWMKDILAPHLLPRALAEMLGQADAFFEGVKNLSAFGIAYTAITAMMLTLTLEETIDVSWRVNKTSIPWSIRERLLIHWALMTAGPLTLLTCLSFLDKVTFSSFWGNIVVFFGLLLFIFALHKMCSKDSLTMKSAFIASFVSTICLLLLKLGFEIWWNTGTSYGTIYGVFAAVMALPLWIWLGWLSLVAPPCLLTSFEKISTK